MDKLTDTIDKDISNQQTTATIVSSLATATPLTSEIVSESFEPDPKFEITTLEKASYEDIYMETTNSLDQIQKEQQSAIGTSLSVDKSQIVEGSERTSSEFISSQTSVDAQMEKVIDNIVELGGVHEFSQTLAQDREKLLESIHRDIASDRSPIDLIADVASKQQSIPEETVTASQTAEEQLQEEQVQEEQVQEEQVQEEQVQEGQVQEELIEKEELHEEPVHEQEKVVQAEPVHEQKGLVQEEPVHEQEKVVQAEPVHEQKGLVQEEPDHEQKGLVQEEPVQEQERLVQEETVHKQEKMIQEEPVHEQEKVVREEPVHEQEKVVREEPVHSKDALYSTNGKTRALRTRTPKRRIEEEEEEEESLSVEPPKKQARRSRGTSDVQNKTYVATKSNPTIKLPASKSRLTISTSNPATRPTADYESTKDRTGEIDKKFVCQECGYSTGRLQNLLDHLKHYCASKCKIGENMKADIIRQQQQTKGKRRQMR